MERSSALIAWCSYKTRYQRASLFVGVVLCTLAGGCDADSKMAQMCSVDWTPEDKPRSTSAECKPTKLCPHKGCKWRHDWCADQYGNEYFPDTGSHTAGDPPDYGFGCDVVVMGKAFDGIKTKQYTHRSRDTLFEVKVANYGDATGVCSFIQDRIWQELQKDVNEEKEIARKCGYDFELIIPDDGLYQRADGYYQPPEPVTVVHESGCKTAPSMPDSYCNGHGTPLTMIPVPSEGPGSVTGVGPACTSDSSNASASPDPGDAAPDAGFRGSCTRSHAPTVVR